MKKMFLFVLLILSHVALFGAEYSIVFIHIGDGIPPYVKIAIEQAALFNRNADIYLIANKKALVHFPKNSIQVSYKRIPCESLRKSAEHKYFLQKAEENFPNPYWRYTTERFFYLDEFMTQYDLKDVFHLENDNMLYVDLKELLPIFQAHYSGIAAPFLNDDVGIAGFVYFSKPSSIHQLAIFMAENVHKQHNDMVILGHFKNHFGIKDIDSLPIVPTKYVETIDLCSRNGQCTQAPYQFQNHFENFQSIFDAAAIGQFFDGVAIVDKGIIIPCFRIPDSIFDPSSLDYKWELDSEGRKVPYAIFAGQKYRINNLHIHTKRLHKYSSK